jgi:hypothetical protein
MYQKTEDGGVGTGMEDLVLIVLVFAAFVFFNFPWTCSADNLGAAIHSICPSFRSCGNGMSGWDIRGGHLISCSLQETLKNGT